jgi:Cu-Zn family superoxide dismutase
MKFRTWMAGVAALSLGACATQRADEPDMDLPSPAGASADVRDPTGRTLARATAEETSGGVRIRVEAAGLVQGAYGVHVHTTGRCDPPDFTSAGPHWNPTGRQHGTENPAGTHKGDLPNLLVGTDGSGSIEFTIPDVSIAGRGPDAMLDADGAAVVVHQGADDYRTDPSGNSGARIGCGVLG